MAAQRLVRRLPVGEVGGRGDPRPRALGPARRRGRRAIAGIHRLGPGPARQPGADAGGARPRAARRPLRALARRRRWRWPSRCCKHRMALTFAGPRRGRDGGRGHRRARRHGSDEHDGATHALDGRAARPARCQRARWGSPRRLPRLVLEARRVAADRGARPARPPPRRLGRDLLAVPPLRRRRAGRCGSTGGARRATTISTCASSEWEAAHTVWLWPDLSRLDGLRLQGAGRRPRRDRALVLAFALADLLVRGGERVGLLGVMRPTASRNVVERMADALAARRRRRREPAAAPSPRSGCPRS